MPPRGRRIDVPPAVTEFVFDTLGFLGRHVAEGVKKAKTSAMREVGAALKKKAEELERAANEDDGIQPEVEVIDERKRRNGR